MEGGFRRLLLFLLQLCCCVLACPVMSSRREKSEKQLSALESLLALNPPTSASSDEAKGELGGKDSKPSFPRLTSPHSGVFPPLIAAILADDLAGCVRLVAENALLVKELDAEGSSPLQWAAALASTEMVAFLLDSGADPQALDHKGLPPNYPPLQIACMQGSAIVARLLLKGGADPNWKSFKGLYAVHHALDDGFCHLIPLLVSYGANVDLAETFSTLQLTLLHMVAMRNEVECAQIVLDAGANILSLDRFEHSALTFAAAGRRAKLVRMLLQDSAGAWRADAAALVAIRDKHGKDAVDYLIQGEPGGATPKVSARGRARPMPTPEGQPERRRVSREVEDELSDSDLVEARKAEIARLLHGALPESEPAQVLRVAARLEEAGVQFAASLLEKRSSSLADGAAVTNHEEL